MLMNIRRAHTLGGSCEHALAPYGLTVRPARASDAAACAPLVFASGEHEFEYFLGVPAEQCVAFLEYTFALSDGRFSWRRHEVAVDARGEIVAVMAAHDGRRIFADELRIVWTVLCHFGPLRTVPILLRGLVLETELSKPKKGQTLIAHCATQTEARGTGVFTTLFEHALCGSSAAERGLDSSEREVVLDVLVSNNRAAALYRRLGFVALPRRRARSRFLPAQLDSVRMLLVDCVIEVSPDLCSDSDDGENEYDGYRTLETAVGGAQPMRVSREDGGRGNQIDA